MVSRLPCIKCASKLSMVEGSLVNCFNCGIKNTYSESVNLLNNYLMEILAIPSIDKLEEQEITDEIIQLRKKSLEIYFHELNSKYYGYKNLIISKLDKDDTEKDKLLDLIRACGTYNLIISQYLLPYLDDDGVSKRRFEDMKIFSVIFHKSLLGLYFTAEARTNFEHERCKENYDYAKRNYKEGLEFLTKTLEGEIRSEFEKHIILFQVLSELTEILQTVLNENPSYYSEDLENLISQIDAIKEKNIQISNLRSQVTEIYNLVREATLILEEIRVADIFSTLDPIKGNLVYQTEEALEKVERIKDWIEDSTDRYQTIQKKLLRLHSGKFVKYLKTYRQEFDTRRNKNIERFDELLDKIISRSIGDYNMETIEILDILSDFIQKSDSSVEGIIQRFEIEHDDLIKFDETLKNLVIELFKKPFRMDLESEHYKALIDMISDKHSEFDRYILKFINSLLREFEENRNEENLSIEDQRNRFVADLRPKVMRSIEASFTLDESLIPYPLFLELIILSRQLTVGEPETISLLMENPSETDFKNVNITFFAPNSFKSRLRFAQMKKIKANEGVKVETEVVPTEKGVYHFMAMVEYTTESTNEMFWMPSIKIELEVEDTLQLS
ncbi:MAG: hypothetical protein ACOC35_11105 [Promethearchaeia archaeon]